jgi:crotonobetainyl-CoA:carnitine CoA-transferase CaiB-like acyl-CoA transferase
MKPSMPQASASSPAVRGPLQGIRILDLTSTLLGPYATQILADLGADVIKVESPDGDIRRHLGAARHAGMTSQYLTVNRGKRNIVVDLKQTAGRAVVLKLCETADALVHNSRREAMGRLGLSYQDVAAANAGIVYCAAVGFGAKGPYAKKPAYDDLIQGLAALPALQERAGGPASFVPMNLADRVCGLALVNVLTSALLYRARSGQGQEVELPMFETMAEFVLSEHMWGHVFVPPAEPMGAVRLFDRRPAKTLDGHICHWIATDRQYVRFVDALGFPEMKTDARFARRAQRYRNLTAFQAFVDRELGRRTTAECIALLEQADIPAMPMHSLESLMDDPHLAAVGFFRTVEHPSEGTIVSMAVPSTWSRSRPDNPRPAAHAGEHSHEVLAEVGYSEAEIEALIASGAVATSLRSD